MKRNAVKQESQGLREKRILTELDRLLKQSIHVAGDPYSTAYRAGQHAVAVWVLHALSTTPKPIQGVADGIDDSDG